VVTFDEARQIHHTLSLNVTPDLCDINGHLTVRHQLGIHDDAAWDLLDSLGMGQAGIADGASFFDLEQHLRYLSESRSGDHLTVHHRVLDVSTSTVHLMSYLVLAERAAIVSTFECLILAVDLATRGPRRFSTSDLQRLVGRVQADRSLSWDPGACGAMGVRKSALAERLSGDSP
jgi:carnitine 3-dehydrogenase